MSRLTRRLKPPEGVTPKVGDLVVYEIEYDDGQIGTITTVVSEFDRLVSKPY